MPRIRPLLMIAILALCGTSFAAQAAEVGKISIEQQWARATAPGANNGAAFMTLVNDGATDKIVAAAADVSDVVELHTHIKDGEVMRMRQVEAIEVTGGSTTALKPGGLHIMLIGLHQPLTEGDSFPLTLTFESGGEVVIDVPVRAMGAMGKSHGHGHSM